MEHMFVMCKETFNINNRLTDIWSLDSLDDLVRGCALHFNNHPRLSMPSFTRAYVYLLFEI